MNWDYSGVIFSTLLIWAAVVVVVVIAARRDKRAPADDIGVLWLVVMAVYATLPPISWVLQGGAYDSTSSFRLFMLQPTDAEVSTLMDLGVAYCGSFATIYVLLGRYIPVAQPGIHASISSARMMAALAFVLLFKAAMLFVSAAGFIRASDSYVDSYLALQQLPVLARQAIKVGAGISLVAQMVVLVAILQRWPRHRLLFVVYVSTVLLSFDPEGARAGVVMGLVSIAIAWHVLVRPISARWWIGAGVGGLFLFIALGLRRGGGAWEHGTLLPNDGVGEFDALWANAVELLRARQTGGFDPPAAARFGEFWAFVPSQLLPFEKSSLADWFLHTFHREEEAMGGGWAFGALSQAVVGEGLLEAVLRGGAMGGVGAWMMRWHRSRASGWWRLPLYLYLLVSLFQSVRDTTFRQLGDILQLAVPALIMVAVLGRLLDRRNGAA